jgi:hypothetical protein
VSSRRSREAVKALPDPGEVVQHAPAGPHCPVCLEMERRSDAYLSGLAKASKENPAPWEDMLRTWGLCRHHTRVLVAKSSRATELYRQLAGELLRRCDWNRFDRYSPGHQAFRALLKPDGMCPACERINEDQRAMVRAIVSALSASEARAVYRTGAGLCLPHLRLALGIVDDPSASSCLVTHFLRGIESFVAASGEDRDGIERLTGYLRRGKAGR